MNCVPRIVVALIASVPLLLCGRVVGQGTSGALADPINTRQLLAYADRLGLSDQQRLAIQSLHDDYKRDFRSLRDGQIASFLAEMRQLQGRMPQRDAVAEIFERMEQLQTKIRILDERLFDRLQPLLTEPQAAIMPRVRMRRERARYEGQQMMWFFGRAPVELSDLFFDLDLTAEELQTADPVMAGYERRLTTAMRKLSRSSSRMYLDLFDRLEERGFTDLSQEDMMADPELAQRMMVAMQEIWVEITKESMKVAADIQDLNRATCRTMSGILSEESGRELRHAFYSATYPEIGHLLALEEQAWMAPALRLETLDDDTRASLAAIVADFRGQVSRIIEQSVALIAEQRESFSPFDFDASRNEESQKKIAELAAKANEINNTMMTSVQELLGAELVMQLARGATPDAAPGDGEEGTTGEALAEPEHIWSGDPFLPSRISHGDVRRWATRLELDEGDATVLEELHLEYVDEFKTLASVKEVTDANQLLWSHVAETGEMRPPEEETIVELYRLRQRAFRDVVDLDNRFLDLVKVAVVTDATAPRLERIRGRRHLEAYSRDAGYYGQSGNMEAAVDVIGIVDEQEITDEDRARIDPVLDAYETNAIDSYRDRYDAQLALQRASDLFNARQTRDADAGNEFDYGMRYREVLGPPTTRAHEANAKVGALNRRLVEEIGAVIDAGAARRILHAYRKQAYPVVYSDAAGVDRHITAAQELEDLSPEQRRQLDELAATYRPDYERLSTEMVRLVSAGGMNTMSFETNDWQEYQTRQEQMQRLHFDRNELSYRAIGRLAAILREDQVARIGGLPELRKDDQGEIYW